MATRPAPIDELPTLLAGTAYRQPYHRYQDLALEAFEQTRARDRRRCYVVLPPGAGKTVLGLEIARRLGTRTLVLCPNTAIQSQWLDQWQDFEPKVVPAGADTELSAPITVHTYQALCNLDSHSDPLPAADIPDAERLGPAELAQQRQKQRILVARGGDREELLRLLHPNGRKLIDRVKASGTWTLILDECHHLLELWGHLVRALAEELGDKVFLVGLTATPPSDMEGHEADLYQHLFGQADFHVQTPAVVKEGRLAPIPGARLRHDAACA